MNGKHIFYNHQAQTTPYPNGMEITRADGMYIYDNQNKKYLDLVAGVSACSLGHSHPNIVEAVKSQSERYMHVMVYGEFIQSPQYELSKLLVDHLPKKLNCTYLVNSGTEAIEGAMKLAKRITERKELISFQNSYHGSTHGALSLMGNELYKTKYRPLLPNCKLLVYNNLDDLEQITNQTAAVIVEPIQGATGFTVPSEIWLKELRKKCTQSGTLLIFDEIQTFGRTGKLFALETFNVTPDILCLAKGMGGGMPIGCFISSKENMGLLKENPKLGHITTFGGHPVSCSAALATLKTLLNKKHIIKEVIAKEYLFREHLKHPLIKKIKGMGLMLAIELENNKLCQKLVQKGYEYGIITFFFLFTDTCVRISPPLIISEKEIIHSCTVIKKILNEISN